MTLKELMEAFMTINAPFDAVRVCEAVTGKTINNISMGQEIYLPREVLNRKVVKWAVTKRPYGFIIVVEPKEGVMQTRKFFDIETREIITEEVLAETLEALKECDPDTYGDITLGQYINNCLTINNGTLEEV